MSVMSGVEATFCRSAPWRAFAGRVVLPWAIQGRSLGADVLELGGVSGAMAAELLRRQPLIDLTVADVDPAMVAVAQRRLASFGDRARSEVADATDLSFEDESFDAVCLWLMLHHTIGWQSAIREVRRVLRPGGMLVGYDLTNRFASRWFHRLDRSPHLLVTPDQLDHELHARSFSAISVQPGLAKQVMRFAATRPAS